MGEPETSFCFPADRLAAEIPRALCKVQGRNEAERIAAALEALIEIGTLTSGQRLPTIRDLVDCGIGSHGTVADAYAIIRRRGLVHTKRRGGTVISTRPRGLEGSTADKSSRIIDLTHATPDPALFPPASIVNEHLAAVPWNYPDQHLHPEYKDFISDTLRPSNLHDGTTIVMPGVMRALDAVLSHLGVSGSEVLVEDPGFVGHHGLVRANGCLPIPLEVDDEGIRPEALKLGLRRKPAAVLFTPFAQNPFGASLTPQRAAELARISRKSTANPVWILDNYMAFPRQRPMPLPFDPLRSSWLCATSVSKLVWPDMRVAALSGTRDVVGQIQTRSAPIDGWVSGTVQRAVARLCRDERIAMSVRAAMAEYDTRRTTLIRAVQDASLECNGSSGLCVWIRVPDETCCVRELWKRGWGVRPGHEYRIATGSGIRVATSHLPSPLAEDFVKDLKISI